MKYKYGLILAVLLLIIDQVIKWWATNHQISNRFIDVVKNNKFILGYGTHFDLFFWLAIFAILILSIIIIGKDALTNYALMFMLAGSISNLIDRFVRGGVIDYFKFNFGEIVHFNLADCYLIFGIFYYLFLLGRQHEKKSSH